MKNKLFSPAFFAAMLPLAIPIALQNLLTTSFRLVDTLMIGRLGDTALASVGLAGNISFIVELIGFGLASGSAVFMAQYHGSGNEDGIRRSFGSALLLILPITLTVTAIAFFFPEELMGITTNSQSSIIEGARYLKTACFSYTGLVLGLVLSVVLRSTENVRLPMIASGISALANAVLNYIFIFGKLGLPAMGVAGAGIATSISSLLNPAIMLFGSLMHKNVLYAPIREFLDVRSFYPEFLHRVLPVLCNELLWSLSIVGMNMVYGRMGDDNYAALTVFRTVENISQVFLVGICNACNILVGMRIGAKKIEEGKTISRQFLLFTPVLGLAIGLTVLVLRGPILSLFELSAAAKGSAMALLAAFSVLVIIQNIPYLTVVGIFRAGGDTKVGLYGDLTVDYFIMLPTAIICGLVLKLPFVSTYVITVLVDNIIKCGIYTAYYFSMRWIKPIKQ